MTHENTAGETSPENRTYSRRIRILDAVVRDYVATHEPVGSRSLVERYNLGVSPAKGDSLTFFQAAVPFPQPNPAPTEPFHLPFLPSLDTFFDFFSNFLKKTLAFSNIGVIL